VNRLLLAGVIIVTVASTANALPRAPFQKIFIVVLENTAYGDALAQPFLADLAARGALLTNFFAEAHPSLPNYVALTAGSTYGLTSNEDVTLDVSHIGDLLEGTGRTWKAYAEGYPGNCFLESSAGAYVRKHVPFLSFRNIQTAPARCQRIVNASALASDIENGTLPDYGLYIPDQNNNGHDTGVAFADQWLARTFGPWLQDSRFTDGRLFVVTFDESSMTAPNQIYTVLYGPGVVSGARSSSRYDHYSLLRMIEDALGLGTLSQQDAQAAAITGVWRPPPARDVDSDGKADVFWRHTSGTLAVWLMNGGTVAGSGSLGGLATDWTVVGLGDTNGDGKADVLWHHASGAVTVWLLDGTHVVGSGTPGTAGVGWTVAGVGDVDGDGKADILWRHTSGTVAVWLLNGTHVVGSRVLGGPGAGWTIAGVGDVDGDGKADILWRHASGTVAVWLLNGTHVVGSGVLGGAGTDWTIVGAGDVNGDGKTDILWRHTSGTVAVWLLDGTHVVGSGVAGAAGTDWTVAGMGDFNGDGKADVLWRHTSGTVAVWLLDGLRVIATGAPGGAATGWQIQ
jgi:hypothetical protein